MTEKIKYGPLVYNHFGDPDDSGNYWWAGNPPVAYEEESGPYRIPVDEDGNQCLPGNCILHPNCDVEEWESFELFKVPSLTWVRSWFDDNFLIIEDYDVCRYILRWCDYNYTNGHIAEFIDWKKEKSMKEMVADIWPDVQT